MFERVAKRREAAARWSRYSISCSLSTEGASLERCGASAKGADIIACAIQGLLLLEKKLVKCWKPESNRMAEADALGICRAMVVTGSSLWKGSTGTAFDQRAAKMQVSVTSAAGILFISSRLTQ